MEQEQSTFLIQAASGTNRHWLWYLFGAFCTFCAFVMGQVPLLLIIQQKVQSGAISTEDAMAFYSSADFNAIGLSSTYGMALVLITFIVGLLGLVLWLKYVHHRPLKTLVTGRRIRWDKLFLGAGIWFVLIALIEIVLCAAGLEQYRLVFNWRAWLPLMVVVICMLPLQTSFEELYVRGYIMQKLGVLSGKPWIAILVTSVFFGLMHINNPEVARFGVWVMMWYYISIGAFLAVITILDDGLEYALGVHLAMNVYGAGFVTYEGSALQTEALVRVSDISPVWIVVLSYVAMVVFIVIIHRYQKLKSWRVVFARLVNVQQEYNTP